MYHMVSYFHPPISDTRIIFGDEYGSCSSSLSGPVFLTPLLHPNFNPGKDSRTLQAYDEVIFLLWTSSVILILMEPSVSETVSAPIFRHFI